MTLLPSDVSSMLRDYTKDKEEELTNKLLSLLVAQHEVAHLNQQYEQLVTDTFKNIMARQKIEDVCSLLNIVWISLRNPLINKSVLINLLDSILQCVGVEDLKQILGIVRERVGQLGQLQSKISFYFLRLINTLLKRISKATDFQLRGQLHLTITRIINFCHESGFEYRQGPAQTNDKIEVQDQLMDSFKDSKISLQFFQNFWELQKYFMDLQELIKVNDKQGLPLTPIKQDPKLANLRLKRVESILDTILNFFQINSPQQNKDFTNFPLKFVKLPNLLVIQLQDSYFRLLILIQVLSFCFNLTHFPTKHQIELNQQSKDIVSRIDKKARDYLVHLVKSRKDSQNLLKFMNKFFINDLFWIQLKDNWRQRKKTFFKNLKQQSNDFKKASSITQNTNTNTNTNANTNTNTNVNVNSSAPPLSVPTNLVSIPSSNAVKKTPTLAETIAKCKKQIQAKMGIEANFIQGFLDHSVAPVLKKQPISPSFQYYYSTARSCLENFDEIQHCQTEFDSRSQYNLFEWKAFRSLQRQRIVTGIEGDKNSKYFDYKLLDFIDRKQQIFQGQPRKRVKLSNQQSEQKANQ